jgi:hypothetical protein
MTGNEACVLPFESIAKEHAMRKVTAGAVAAAVGLLSVAPAFAIDVDLGPNGIRIGPRYQERYHERYFDERPYYRADCRKVTIDRPDGSRVVKYRCD